MLADRQTDRQTHIQTCSSQYFATALAGEVINNINKAIVDHTLPKPPKLPLPLGITSPRRRTEPQPHATCAKKLVKIARVAPEICSRTDRQTNAQTDTQTYVLITILHHCCRGRSNQQHKRVRRMQ